MVYDLVVMSIYVIMIQYCWWQTTNYLFILREYTISIKDVALERKISMEVKDEH
jgi:hypothetical protein